MLCKHDWRKIGKVEHISNKKAKQFKTAMCICDKCGKIKEKKFTGYIVNSII